MTGIGAQAKALKNLKVPFEHHRICEWAYPSILAYNEIHHKELPNYGIDFAKDKSKEEIIDFLFNKGISSNYNVPMKKEQIKRLDERKIRKIYNAIHSTNDLVNVEQVKGYDLGITNTDKYDYILTYSFPCQDLSLAGKRAGMDKNSNTRSGMLWQVERILKECKELGHLPQILLMENVPQVCGADNVENFVYWQQELETLGYKNYFDILNSKDYGIPQSRERCFMVSILGDYSYSFPSKIPLKLKLKDMLEKEVDEKYYLRQEQIKSILNWNAQQEPYETLGKEICPTLTTRSGAYAAGMVLTSTLEDSKEEKKLGEDLMKIKTIGNYSPSGHNAARIVDPNGLAPTVMGNHGTVTAIVEPRNFVDKKITMFAEKNGYIPEIFNPYNAYEIKDGIAPTLICTCGNPSGISSMVFTKTQAAMITEDGNIRRYLDSDVIDEFKEGECADISFPNGYNKGNRVFKQAPTLNTTTTQSSLIFKESDKPIRIRKLTAKEACRLMGFDDEDYENASKVVSDNLIFHQCGDSIVTWVLYYIFKQML